MKRLILTGLILVLGAAGLPAAETNAVQVLTLAAARQLALQNHPRIAEANFQTLAAEEAVKETGAAELPSAYLYGTAAGANMENERIMAGGINNPSVYNRIAGGLGVSQLITDFGRTSNLKASSQLAAEAENQNAAETREQVWLQVSTSYYDVLAAQAVLQVAQDTLQTRTLLVEQVSTLATNKLKSGLDVSYARVAQEEARLLVEKAQNNVDATMAALSTALGLREWRQFKLVEPPPSAAATNDAEQLVQTALEMRPELLSLRDQRDSSQRLAQSEKDARRPVVSAEGVIGNSPNHDARLADNYAAADLNISLPLYTGGLYLARQHRAELQAEAEDEQLRTAEDDVIRDVRVAWLNVNNTRELVETTKQLVDHANEALDLATARYQAGLNSIVELTEVQLSQVSARIALVNAHYDLLSQEANLDYQTGMLH